MTQKRELRCCYCCYGACTCGYWQTGSRLSVSLNSVLNTAKVFYGTALCPPIWGFTTASPEPKWSCKIHTNVDVHTDSTARHKHTHTHTPANAIKQRSNTGMHKDLKWKQNVETIHAGHRHSQQSMNTCVKRQHTEHIHTHACIEMNTHAPFVGPVCQIVAGTTLHYSTSWPASSSRGQMLRRRVIWCFLSVCLCVWVSAVAHAWEALCWGVCSPTPFGGVRQPA